MMFKAYARQVKNKPEKSVLEVETKRLLIENSRVTLKNVVFNLDSANISIWTWTQSSKFKS